MEKTKFKQRFYKFFTSVKDIDKTVQEFWQIHKKNIKPFYANTQREDDVIISASPYFLLEPIIKELGIKHLMASNVDKFSGKYDGINCHGKEKVRRFYEVYPDGVIDEFYSDSLSDSPLAEISKKAIMVKDFDLLPWPEK
jgi:phosphoserine phosphatase